MLNTETCEWNQISSKSDVLPRRNHAACRESEFMYIYGGVDSYGKTLKDLWRFNLSIIHTL